MLQIRSAVWWLAAAGFLFLMYLSYFASFPIPEFFQKIISLVFEGGFLFACWSVGVLVFQYLKFTPHPFWLRQVGRGAIGAGFLGTFIVSANMMIPHAVQFILGLALFLLIGAAAVVVYQGHVKSIFGAKLSSLNFTITEIIVLFSGTLGLLLTFLACFSPITYYDSLVYHLALPSIYVQKNSIAVVPYNLYSFFPALMEMLFMFSIKFLRTPDYAINLLGFAMSLGCSAVIVEWAYEIAGKKSALLVFLLWWTCPAVLLLSLGAYVDIPLAFWAVLAVRVISLALPRGESAALVVGGLLAGCAVATKYTGGSVVVLLAIVLMTKGVRQPIKLGYFLAGSLIAPLPWLIKNWLAVGNPIFPFAYNFFGTGDIWTHASAAHYFALLTEYDRKSQLIDWLLRTPLLLINQPLHFGGGIDVLGDFGWPLFLLALPFFFLQKKLRGVRWLGLYAIGAVGMWYFSKPVLRFLVIILPVLVLLGGLTIGSVFENVGWRKWVATFCVFPLLVSNFFLYAVFASDLKLFDVALGISTAKEFLNQRLVYHPVYEYINENLSNSDNVFLLGEQRTYGLYKPFIASNLFAETPLATICNQASSSASIINYFRENHVTFLLASEQEISRLGGLGAFGFTENGSAQLRNFLSKNVTLVNENRAVKLLQINY